MSKEYILGFIVLVCTSFYIMKCDYDAEIECFKKGLYMEKLGFKYRCVKYELRTIETKEKK